MREVQLTCKECGTKFKDRRGTKYCKACRPIINRRRASEYRKKHPYKSLPNYCKCGKLIAKYKKYCDECMYNFPICIVCNKRFKKEKKYTSYFCSQKCSHKFYSRKNVMKMYNELIELKERYKQNDGILKTQQQLTDELLERNNELRQRINYLEALNESKSIMPSTER